MYLILSVEMTDVVARVATETDVDTQTHKTSTVTLLRMRAEG